MDANDIKRLLQARPFRPFTVYLPNDRAFTIQHPEFGWLAPNGRTLVVAPAPPQKGVDLLDVRLITRVATEDAPTG